LDWAAEARVSPAIRTNPQKGNGLTGSNSLQSILLRSINCSVHIVYAGLDVRMNIERPPQIYHHSCRVGGYSWMHQIECYFVGREHA